MKKQKKEICTNCGKLPDKNIQERNKDCIYEFINTYCQGKTNKELVNLWAKEIREYQKFSFNLGFNECLAEVEKMIRVWFKKNNQNKDPEKYGFYMYDTKLDELLIKLNKLKEMKK